MATGFFNKIPVATRQQGPRNSLINVGGEQFQALAVALIDSVQHELRLPEAPLKKIVDRFLTLFPQYKITESTLITPIERIKMLFNHGRKSELVSCLAYVLRQLAVDELYQHPLSYRDSFHGLSEDTPVSHLRQSTSRLPLTALSALANSLEMTVTLSFKEPGKELRNRVIVNQEVGNSPRIHLVLQVQNEFYFPQVRNPEEFKYVGQLAATPLKPVQMSADRTETISEMLQQIKMDNKYLLQTYTQWRKNLLSMITAGDLTQESLLTLYVTFLPVDSILYDVVAELGSLDKASMVLSSMPDTKQQINEMIVSALANWITTRRVNPDILFDSIENPDRQPSPSNRI